MTPDSTVIHLPSRDVRQSHAAFESYQSAACAYRLSPSQDNWMAAREAYAKWVRVFVGGDEAEALIGKFGETIQAMGMSA